MKKIILFLLAMVMLGGCAQTVWVHPEYTPEKWKKDSYECEKDARQSGYFGTGITGSINMQNFFNRCLESKGWMRQTAQGVKDARNDDYCLSKEGKHSRGERICLEDGLYQCDYLPQGRNTVGWRKLENNCP